MSDPNAGGPSSNEAQPEETVVERQASKDAEDEFRPFDELTDGYGEPERGAYVRGVDGGPVAVDETTTSDIPALSTKTLVCMGDFSSFVLRNRHGVVLSIFAATEVVRMPNGAWTVPLLLAIERSKLPIERERERILRMTKLGSVAAGGIPIGQEEIKKALDEQVLAHAMARMDGTVVLVDPERVTVEPIRPPCRHYVRQQVSFELNAAHARLSRLCAARRTTEGTFMTVSDTGIFACDMRDPYDAESAAVLDEFDAKKIAQGVNREFVPMILAARNVVAEIAPSDGGIFSPPK
jgi:hypothetical protein